MARVEHNWNIPSRFFLRSRLNYGMRQPDRDLVGELNFHGSGGSSFRGGGRERASSKGKLKGMQGLGFRVRHEEIRGKSVDGR